MGLDDVVGAYLKTQQALGEIFFRNRPIQGLFPPIFCFRQLPSASVRRRHLLEPQLAPASGRAFSVMHVRTRLGKCGSPRLPYLPTRHIGVGDVGGVDRFERRFPRPTAVAGAR